MKYSKIHLHSPQFLSLTGLTVSEFDALAKDFEVDVKDHLSRFTFEGKRTFHCLHKQYFPDKYRLIHGFRPDAAHHSLGDFIRDFCYPHRRTGKTFRGKLFGSLFEVNDADDLLGGTSGSPGVWGLVTREVARHADIRAIVSTLRVVYGDGRRGFCSFLSIDFWADGIHTATNVWSDSCVIVMAIRVEGRLLTA